MPKPVEHYLTTVAEAIGRKDRAEDIFQRVADALQDLVGFRLFTMLRVTSGGEEVARVYSTDLEAYPLKGRKRMGPTPWGDCVIRSCKPFLGTNDDDIRWAFPDHELIRSLGLASVINVPVVRDGRCLGTLNLLHEAAWYRQEQIAPVQRIADLLVPVFADAAAGEIS